MNWKNKDIYFETSAVNYLSKQLTLDDAPSTKAYQRVRGNRWYLSSVTVWEILVTSDEKRKEDILSLSQQLFYEKLLYSPSELIIKYILKGCPLYENKVDIHSKSRLQHVWDDLCRDKNKTFIYDKKQLQTKTKHIQIISRQLFKIINRIVIDSKPNDFGSRLDLFLSSH